MPEHYENFPVASLLCPARLRPPIAAIYAYARTADDLADEGDATPDQRLQDLGQMRSDLLAIAAGRAHSGRWPDVFDTLESMLVRWGLPAPLLADLIDAFMQDVRYTQTQHLYADRNALMDYCRRSANPVGRLLLHLHGIDDDASLAQSDAICSALQLINFWQDLSVDLPRGRCYLTRQDCARHDVDLATLTAGNDSLACRKLVAELTRDARSLMLSGAPLVKRIPGRAGWELRLVVQGGLRILDKIQALDYGTFRQRPVIQAKDMPLMVWRACWM